MKTATPSLQLSIAIATLLTGTALVAPHAVSAAASDLQAQTGWAISRVASTTKGSYCTMAQKYSNGTVLTIAKNSGNEYSLAFDFQSPKFQVGKVTPASVRAGSGTAQTFEVQPASPQVVVIGLGPDEAFMNTLKESGKVQLEIEGESYAFNTAKFGEAQDELSTCMSSMKSQVREAKATEAQQAEQAEKAEKVAAAEPAPAAAPAPVTEKIIFDEPPAKTASAAKSSGLSAEDLTAAPVEPLAAPATVTAMAAPAPAVASSNASALEAENARLKQALGEARRSYENQMTAQQGARIPELQEKIDGLQAENARLRDEAAKAAAQASSKQDLTRVSAELEKARKDLAAVQAQNTTLQAQIAQAQQSEAASANEKQLSVQVQREVEALKAENQTLKNQLQLSANAEQKAPSAETTKLADLQAENAALKTNLDLTNKKVSELQAAAASQKSAPVAKNDPASAEMQKRISELQAENASLKAQAQDALTPMAQANAGELTPSDQENLRGQIRDLRSQLEIVESESEGLRKQLETAQRDSEGKQLKVAGGNWDLEQATRRYQESQREIRRLGALLEQDRVKCQEEKKDIEYMLFDPEVAKPAQIAMLGSLEDQIAAKDARIAELEGRAPVAVEAKADSKQQAVASEKLLAADVKPMVESEPLAESKPLQAPNSPTQVAARPVESAPVAPAPVAAAAPQQAPAAPVAQSSKFQSSQDFTSILKSAGLTIRGTVQPVQKVASDNYKAYSWQTDSLFGSAEQRAMADKGGFEPAVQQYIDRAKSRCQGEFAAVPAQISGSIPAEGYEIACVSGQTGSSASVLFTYKDGIMTTVAHEGRAEAMDIAMDARDRVAAKIVAN